MTAHQKTLESPDGLAGPCPLFHVTTGRKAKLYRQTGRINSPVRGFDTLMAAMAWGMKTGRKVILRVEPVATPQMLPDHHNEYGRAWWTESVPIERVKCVYSAEGAWTQPDTANVSRGQLRYDAYGELRCLCESDGYVMVRRRNAMVFVKSVREWDAMRKCRTIDELSGKPPGSFARFIKEHGNDPSSATGRK